MLMIRLFFSKILCAQCLESLMQRVWPRDIGINNEGQGPQLSFLHVKVCIDDEASVCPIRIFPLVANIDFVLEKDHNPRFSKLAPFISSALQPVEVLRSFLWCKLCMFNRVLQGETTGCSEALVSLVVEAVLLMWPIRWISSCLSQLPRRHRSNFCALVRWYGRRIRYINVASPMPCPIFKILAAALREAPAAFGNFEHELEIFERG